jgi:hypothetical protein
MSFKEYVKSSKLKVKYEDGGSNVLIFKKGNENCAKQNRGTKIVHFVK